jgi:ribonuclease HI
LNKKKEQIMNNTSAVTIYTDGGCDPNPGLGAYASILQSHTAGTEKIITGVEADTTNYRMELMAVVAGLEALKRPTTVTVVCDNDNVVKGATQWLSRWVANDWRNSRGKAVEHRDLWERVQQALTVHTVQFVKVRAHVAQSESSEAERMNQRADQLVAAARADYGRTTPSADTQANNTDEHNYRLYIAGSRQASANMLEYARCVVARAIDKGWTIVVGDNPQGVDQAIVDEAQRLNYSDVIVVGIARQPRNGGVTNGRYLQIGTSYSQRDQAMARSSDRGLFIWNGSSTGTRRAADYMQALPDKTVHLMDFAKTMAQV